MTTKPPLRPATPIDTELVEPLEDLTEIEKRKRESEGKVADDTASPAERP